MSMFDSFKDKVKEQQEKIAEQKDNRGSKLAALSVQYMGGYSDKKKATGKLTFYQKQTEFSNPMLNSRLGFTIINTNIADITFSGKDDVIQQRTITRNLLLAGKSKSKEIKDAYITITLADGQEVLFHVPEKSPMELKASIAGAVSQAKQSPHSSVATPQTTSTADELVGLAKLKEQGIITQAEFDQKKKQILGL